jgi:hypothetical protein
MGIYTNSSKRRSKAIYMQDQPILNNSSTIGVYEYAAKRAYRKRSKDEINKRRETAKAYIKSLGKNVF